MLMTPTSKTRMNLSLSAPVRHRPPQHLVQRHITLKTLIMLTLHQVKFRPLEVHSPDTCIGSPPRPSSFALPNNVIGNSNGRIPESPDIQRPEQRPGWFRRFVGVAFPSSVSGNPSNSGRPIGGGIENDGVFANINAKPGRGRIVQDGDSGIHVVPEEVQKESPPSVRASSRLSLSS